MSESGAQTESRKAGFGKRGAAMAGLLGVTMVSCQVVEPEPPKPDPASVLQGMNLAYGSPAMLLKEAPKPAPKKSTR